MEETLVSLKMKEIDLLNKLEKISSLIPNRILKVEGYILKENQLTNFKLFKSPLKGTKDNFIRENKNSVFFLNQSNWI